MAEYQCACSVTIAWCNDCKCVHVGLFDDDLELVGMGNVVDVDQLISMLQQAKSNKQMHWMLVGERPQRMQ
jgi:hypothetical protein